MNLEIVSKAQESALLSAGIHKAEIASIEPRQASESEEYKDKTPQLAVIFKKAGKMITRWYNLKGFLRFGDLSANDQKSGKFDKALIAGTQNSKDGPQYYAVNAKTGTRVESEDRTAAAMDMLGNLANCTGIPDGKKVSLQDLIGSEVGIKIIEENNAITGKPRATVSSVFQASRVPEEDTEEVFE